LQKNGFPVEIAEKQKIKFYFIYNFIILIQAILLKYQKSRKLVALNFKLAVSEKCFSQPDIKENYTTMPISYHIGMKEIVRTVVCIKI
jgi:hypothetical protein